MKVLGPADQPFLTEDSILAFALYLAGSHFSDDELPCVNYYTADMLRQLGYKGLLPSEAALKAVENKQKGVTTYMFKAPEGRLFQAFEDQKQYLEKAEGTARDVVRNLMTDFSVGARSFEETMMRLVCTIVYMRAEFTTMWQKHDPLIRIDDPEPATSETLPDGSRLMSHNGFKFVGARAGEETQKRLGLC